MKRNEVKWWWKFRWLSFLYALLHGYFWLPCPLCGKNFGGHEWLDRNRLMTSLSSGEGVCPNCGEKAKKLNQKFMASNLEAQNVKLGTQKIIDFT